MSPCSNQDSSSSGSLIRKRGKNYLCEHEGRLKGSLVSLTVVKAISGKSTTCAPCDAALSRSWSIRFIVCSLVSLLLVAPIWAAARRIVRAMIQKRSRIIQQVSARTVGK